MFIIICRSASHRQHDSRAMGDRPPQGQVDMRVLLGVLGSFRAQRRAIPKQDWTNDWKHRVTCTQRAYDKHEDELVPSSRQVRRRRVWSASWRTDYRG
jgi:hypothetical protein